MSHFDKVAKEWDSSDRRQMVAADTAKAIIDSKLLHPNMHLLDFGTGTGLLTKHLCPLVRKITALDFSQAMLKQLNSNAKEWKNCQINSVHSDILKYNSDVSFNGIVSSMSMHHIEELDALFKKFSALLLPHGFIAIADLEKEDGSFHSDSNDGVFHFGFTKEILEPLLKKHGFKRVMFITTHTVVKENNKKYPLFLLTAIKS